VEAQIEESAAVGPARRRLASSAELQRQQKKAGLLLSRSRVAEQLEASGHERYSAMLRRALAELDEQVAAMTE